MYTPQLLLQLTSTYAHTRACNDRLARTWLYNSILTTKAYIKISETSIYKDEVGMTLCQNCRYKKSSHAQT